MEEERWGAALRIVKLGDLERAHWQLETLRLCPGASLVELVALPEHPLKEMLGIRSHPLDVASIGQSRVLDYVRRGFAGIEQWQSADPCTLLVTVAMARAE